MSSEPARSTGPDTFVAVAPFWYATNLGGLVMNGVVAATDEAEAREDLVLGRRRAPRRRGRVRLRRRQPRRVHPFRTEVGAADARGRLPVAARVCHAAKQTT